MPSTMALTGDIAAFSVSKTLSLISSLPQTSRPLSFPSHISLSLSNPLLKPSQNLHFRPSVLRAQSSNGAIDAPGEPKVDGGEVEEEELLDYEGYQSEGSDEDFIIDEEELEAEARVAVREFSTSLSRELRIGMFS